MLYGVGSTALFARDLILVNMTCAKSKGNNPLPRTNSSPSAVLDICLISTVCYLLFQKNKSCAVQGTAAIGRCRHVVRQRFRERFICFSLVCFCRLCSFNSGRPKSQTRLKIKLIVRAYLQISAACPQATQLALCLALIPSTYHLDKLIYQMMLLFISQSTDVFVTCSELPSGA